MISLTARAGDVRVSWHKFSSCQPLPGLRKWQAGSVAEQKQARFLFFYVWIEFGEEMWKTSSNIERRAYGTAARYEARESCRRERYTEHSKRGRLVTQNFASPSETRHWRDTSSHATSVFIWQIEATKMGCLFPLIMRKGGPWKL